MIRLELFQSELQWRIGPCGQRGFRRRGSGRGHRGCQGQGPRTAAGLRRGRSGRWNVLDLVGVDPLGRQVESLDGLLGRRVGTDTFLAGDEIEDVAALMTLSEAVPEVLADADPELGGV